MSNRERRIEVDRHRCSGCGKCVEVCPEGVLEVRGIRLWLFRHEHATPVRATRCVGCGACVKACPERALILRVGARSQGAAHRPIR